jgi:hypothetical protein
MRKLFLLILLLAAVAGAQRKTTVRTYTRKDGTVVHSHTRNAPGTKAGTTPVPPTPWPTIHRANSRRIARSEQAKRLFKSAHPCPSTGKKSGACPGFVIDHRIALACGGADAPSNMQWQTTGAAKNKDKWERSGCTAGR